MEQQTGGKMNFSQNNETTSFQSQTQNRQLESFKEESNESMGFNQISSSSIQSASSMQSKSSIHSSSINSSSSQQVSSSKQFSSSAMSMSSQQKTESSKAVTSSLSDMFQQDIQHVSESKVVHNQEIQQDALKTQIVSAISDLEGDRDFVDFGRENKPIDLTSPPQSFSPVPKSTFTPTKQDPFSPAKQDMFSPPPLEQCEPPQPAQPSQSEPAASVVPSRNAATNGTNGLQNGFTDFISSKNLEVQTIQEESLQTQTFQTNGNGYHEESGGIQGSGSSNSLLQKIMTPASVEYDSGSLKRRDPRKMFTDSSFYNSAHHPTVADQVEMAHRLSSAMFNDKNKASSGQKMFLTRMENSGGFHDETPQHDSVPNMKLVMNPEGKVHEWDDIPMDQRPDYSQVAVHAAPNLNIPDVADPVAESLNAGIGKGGELFAKRRKRAENWVVDEASAGQAKPSTFADKFIQEQTEQQIAFQQQQTFEQQQKDHISQQQTIQRESELLKQQQESKQAFAQQQQFKQEQSLEIRRQQEEQMKMAQQQIDFPQNFQHTDLKNRSFTPSLDLSVHNVQGINVWANTAPRGWSSGYQRTMATPPKATPPTVSVCPATPSVDTDMLQRMEQTRIQEEEERMRLETIKKEEFRMQQEEQMQIQRQQEEQMRMQQQQEEQKRIQEQQQAEQMRIQQQQEEQMRIQQQQAEQMRIQQQQEEQMRIQQQQAEQMKIQQQQEEQMRIQQQQAEQMRIQQQQEETMRIQQQQAEQMRIQQQQEEQMRIQQQQAEQMRIQQQQAEQMRIQQQQEEQRRIQQQEEKRKSAAIEADLEAQKRREYEDWFRTQEKEALEYSASVRYQEKAGEEEENERTIVSSSSAHQQSSSQRLVQNSEFRTQQGFAVETRPDPVLSQPKPQMTSSSFSESHQTQSSSVQQSSSSYSHQEASRQVFESQEFNGGYQAREDVAIQQSNTGERNIQDSGVFGGIGGDRNSLVDAEFDYKKHSVKDLAKHFALVKPKQDISHNILPEQRMYNGNNGPALNYLSSETSQTSSSSVTTSRREVSQQDVEASKRAYEMKKQQQQLEAQQTSQQTSQQSSQTTVVRREESSSSSAEQQTKTERRQSLSQALLMDPALAHAEAGIIDPSAILRGSEVAGRSRSEGLQNQSSVQGESDKILNKWDNHNSIARGWAGVKENYHPVTFRGIYNVDSQKNGFSSQNL